MTILAPLLASLLLAVTPPLPSNVERIDGAGGLTQYRLRSNGMTILMAENHAAPVITFLVVYHVGSRNEAPGNTGSAHLLEHMIFNKSTENFGKAKGHRTFQEVLYEAGADFTSTNMTTWNDRMNGYSTVPAGQLDLAMRIEADRLARGLILDEERRSEMSVVRNEYEIGENDPANALDKAVVGAAIVAHPYHWDTIGYRSDIEGVSTAKLREHYRTFFWPGNAEAVLVGDFDPAAALSLFDRTFGALPRSPSPIPQVVTVEPPQEGERRVVVRRTGGVGIVEVAYPRPGTLHADFLPLQVLASILGEGRSSRLHQALVEKGLASSVSAENFAFRDPFLLQIAAKVAPAASHARAEEAIKAVLAEVGAGGVTDQELERAKSQIEVAVVKSRDGTYPFAAALGEAVASADWRWFVGYPQAVRKVTASDVKRVAAAYLVPDHATVGWYVPEEAANEAAQTTAPRSAPIGGAGKPLLPDAAATTGPGPSGNVAPVPGAPSSARRSFAARTHRTVLPNGVTVDVVENHAVPSVALHALLLAGGITAPSGKPVLPRLTAMMVQRGTARRGKLAIDALLDGAGASLTFTAAPEETTIAGAGLARDLPLLLEVLGEELSAPSFPPDELSKAKAELKAEFLQAFDSTRERGYARMTELVFPEGHPYRRATPDEQLASLESATGSDVKAFHAARYVGGSLFISIVGDVDAGRALALAEKALGSLPRGTRPALPGPATSRGTSLGAVVTMKGKANMNLLLGEASGLRFQDADYEAALVANGALGQTALTSRIGKRVRDAEGLSYSLASRFFLADVLDGMWAVSVNVAPPNLARALKSTREEIDRFCREGATEAEVAEQKSFFAGNYQVRLGTNSGVAAALASAEKWGKGPGYLDEFPGRIAKVTREQVNAAIRAHLDPGKLHLVVAGDLERLPE
jgi:zinc protease